MYLEVVARQMESRWRRCIGAEQITLNLKLIQVPTQYIDFVIVHELCQLVEHKHCAELYTLINRMMPDWEERRKKLNTFEF